MTWIELKKKMADKYCLRNEMKKIETAFWNLEVQGTDVTSSQFDIAPTVLDHDYAVELADGRIVGVNTVIRSCTLNFLNHPFNIDLMPVEMGSLML
nr:reverse transcriptase domain-containing protein [Tanacetum cinerariifolium]